ncbi:MAG: hypothetical protein V4501_08725 [Pseudomonadota bacterium]
MIDYLYQTSDFNLFLLLSFFFIFISACALFFIRWFFPLHLRYQENAVIGCTSALIIMIYGVLAGFATLYLINNNNLASDAVQREASAVADMYQVSQGLANPARTQIQADMKNYLDEVIKIEWPLMSVGKAINDVGSTLIGKVVNQLTHYTTSNSTETIVLTHMLGISKNLYDARQQRIQMSYTSLSNEIWVVILVGTILTLCVSYLFGVNFYLHFFIVIAAALMTSSIIFLLISLDKPFQGEFLVGPDMYQTVLTFLNKS